MRSILLSLCFLAVSYLQGQVIVGPPPSNYYPNNNYYIYTPYQPYNGPMRGPNSIEGHKSPREQFRSTYGYYP